MSAVIVPGAGSLWLLGERTPSGIQTSIDNFLTLQEARTFCRNNGIRFSAQIGATAIGDVQLNLLLAAADGPARLAALAKASRTSIAAARRWGGAPGAPRFG